MEDKAKILVICGPTATGKTSLSVALAKQMDGEIISADSMQIYKGLNIGTAKVTRKEMQGIPHHMVDFLSPEVHFSVADYVTAAARCIAEISSRGKLPIVVGGTGLYISSLINGVSFAADKPRPEVRAALQQQLAQEGIEPLYARLCEVDPAYAKTLHPNNHGRVLRALELYLQTGKTMSQQLADSLPPQRPYHDIVVGLDFASRETLYQKIDARVDQMMAHGLLTEASLVHQNRTRYLTAAQAIGYKELFPYLEQRASLESCVAQLKQASRNYAKRQLTWFRRVPQITWMMADDSLLVQRVIALL